MVKIVCKAIKNSFVYIKTFVSYVYFYYVKIKTFLQFKRYTMTLKVDANNFVVRKNPKRIISTNFFVVLNTLIAYDKTKH